MSFDVSIVRPACKCCGRDEEDVYSFNLTHNVNEIIDRCLVAAGAPVAKEPGHGYEARSWGRLYGWSTDDAAPILRRAYEEAKSAARAAEFGALEPDNGWGSLDSVKDSLVDFAYAASSNPGCKIEARG